MAKRVSDRQFAQSRHRYTDPRTGQRVVGVTTVVGSFDAGDKLGAGAAAAVKLTKAGVDYWAEWNGKKNLGSRVHGYASLWVAGRAAEVLETDEGHMDAFARFCDEYRPEWIETEAEVVSHLGYGGRFDAVAWFPPTDALREELGADTPGAFVLLDFKTGKHYPIELALQLAGYRYADGLIAYDEDGWARDLRRMPHIDRCAGLYLTGDGNYELHWAQADEKAFLAFQQLLYVKLWSTTVEKA